MSAQFAAELVKDVQCPERLAVVGPAVDEVIGPDMVAVFRPQPNNSADSLVIRKSNVPACGDIADL